MSFSFSLSAIGQRSLRYAGAMALALAAAAGPALADGSTLNVTMHSGLRTLDPVLSTAHIVRDYAYMVYDVLVAQDANMVTRPEMADWTVSADGLTYVFTLRDGLKFHDGAPVTSKDVVASLKRWGQRDSGGQFIFAVTKALEATDDKTVTWTLRSPFPQLIDTLGKPSAIPAFIMPERVADTPVDTAITETIGSGPFTFDAEAFQPGVKVVFHKFKDYVPRNEPASGMAGGKVVNVDTVQWITMPDAQTAAYALVSGEIDLLEQVSADIVPVLLTSEDVAFDMRDPYGYQVAARINFVQPPFNDVRIRRAAMLAFDQNEFMAAMIGNPKYYSLCSAVLGCGTLYGDETGGKTLTSGGDLKAAKALLADAGYDGTPVVILQSVDIPGFSSLALVAAQELRAAGFVVDIQPMDWQTLTMRRGSKAPTSEGGWSLFFTTSSIVELDTPLKNSFLTSNGDGAWFGWPNDPEMEALRAEFTAATTPEARAEAAKAVQKRAMDFVTFIPLGQYVPAQARSRKVEGMLPSPVITFWNLTKSD